MVAGAPASVIAVRTGEPARGQRLDIQGLRGLAVLSVVLYHAGVSGVTGGFVGVDVFFVVSGFLITGLLWRELSATGSLRLARFYGARARRLLPAGILVAVASAGATVVLLPPLRAREVLGDALASTLYTENYRLAVQGTDYLADGTDPSPFQHYWSLAVEEQFYLLWPALLVVAAWAGRSLLRARRGPVEPSSRGGSGGVSAPAVIALALVAAASFWISLVLTRGQPSWAYFSLPSRAWELALGGLVALTAQWWQHVPRAVAGAVGLAGLVAVLHGCLRLNAATPYPGVAALAPVLGTALVIGAGCASPLGPVGRLLGRTPLRQLGGYSYSLYLWHWPLLVLAPAWIGHPLSLPARLAVAGVAGALAVATTRVVENPLRFAAPLRRSPRRSLALGAGATAVGVAASLALALAVPGTVGQGRAAAPPLLTATGDTAPAPQVATQPADPRQARVQALTEQVQQLLAASASVQDVPSNLAPALDAVAQDTAAPFRNGCLRGMTDQHQPTCASADTASPTRVALIGDSHAAMWHPAFEQIADQRQWRLETLTHIICPVVPIKVMSPDLHREYTECENWRSGILDRLRAEHPALVVVDQMRHYSAAFGFTPYSAEWLAATTALVADLRATGARVLVLGPVPDPHVFVPACVSGHLDSVAACSPDRPAAVDDAGIAAERNATLAAGGQYVDLTDLFCTRTRCPVIVGNQLVYHDDSHVLPEYVATLTPVLAAMVDAAEPGG